jgi:hypothetical protein
MSLLSQVKKGKVTKPALILLYGPDGVGKSTFGADAPSPIFLGTEDGTSNLDVARFPAPRTFDDVLQAIEELTKSAHEFKTLVVDSLDWLEPLVWDKVCVDAGAKSIEQVGGGYGKGYAEALALWRKMASRLLDLQKAKKMNVVLIAHSQIKPFNDPTEQSTYDRQILKLNEKASALFREFVDCVFFATFEVNTKKDGSKTRAFGDGARFIYTERRPGYDAKNRFGLPHQFPLAWDEYVNAMQTVQTPTQVKNLKANIDELLAQLKDDKLVEAVHGHVEKAGDNVERLAQIQDKLRAKIAG